MTVIDADDGNAYFDLSTDYSPWPLSTLQPPHHTLSH